MASVQIRWQDMREGREKYQAYLASREWDIACEPVKARSGGNCERCKHSKAAHVHHRTYIRKYREVPGDLIHLCVGCHNFEENISKDDPVLYWKELLKPPYRFVFTPEGVAHQHQIECPTCRGDGNNVHLKPVASTVGGRKSETTLLRFWCECGTVFDWQLVCRHGTTTVECEVIGIRELV